MIPRREQEGGDGVELHRSGSTVLWEYGGNFAGSGKHSHSSASQPRPGLFGQPPTKPSTVSPMLVIRRPTNLCVCAPHISPNLPLLFLLNGNTQWRIDDDFQNCFIYDGRKLIGKTQWKRSYACRCLVINNCNVLALFLILYWYCLYRSSRIPAIFSNLFGFFFLTMRVSIL